MVVPNRVNRVVWGLCAVNGPVFLPVLVIRVCWGLGGVFGLGNRLVVLQSTLVLDLGSIGCLLRQPLYRQVLGNHL